MTQIADGLVIRPLAPAEADHPAVVGAMVDLINEVYRAGGEGLWSGVADRTTAEEVSGLVRAGEIVVARSGAEIVGTVRVQRLDPTTGELGFLAASSARQGSGIGRRLVEFAEQQARDDGCTTMQLELLVPKEWTHPVKAFLNDWYLRLGYRVVRIDVLEKDYPHLVPLLATPCDFLIYHKDLRG
jgi:ribosomal protein S18 acetylase RimI-like enzyme